MGAFTGMVPNFMNSAHSLTLLVFVILFVGCHPTRENVAPASPTKVQVVYSQPYLVDRLYPSMTGPTSLQEVYLGNPEERELCWIVGYDTEIVPEHSSESLQQEFMCHANLDLSPNIHRMHLNQGLEISGRLFTLSQGQQSIRFPHGFGIPVLSNHSLHLATQVLNLNQPNVNRTVRHKVRIHYLEDSQLKEPMTALFMLGVEVLRTNTQSARSPGFGLKGSGSGAGCGIAVNADPSGIGMLDEHGQEFYGHWVVPPGRERSRTDVTQRLKLPHDVRVHYISAHLHPTAESLELADTTMMEQLFRAEVKNSDEGLGIDEVNHYSSSVGFPLLADHSYSLISVYDNKTNKPVDSMAVMYLYCADPNFDKKTFLASEIPLTEVYPRGTELDFQISEQTIDATWYTNDSFQTVQDYYKQLLSWSGPHEAGPTSCYWVLGDPLTLSLGEGPVEPRDGTSETGLLWIWGDEESGLTIRYSHWTPAAPTSSPNK
jgi:hypothetical protein